MTKVLFVETSAFLRMIFNEKGSNEIEGKLRSAKYLIASRLLKLETQRALHRLRLLGGLSESALVQLENIVSNCWSVFSFLEVDKEILEYAGLICPNKNLRTLDAIHLASYFRLKQSFSSIELLSTDNKIIDAALSPT